MEEGAALTQVPITGPYRTSTTHTVQASASHTITLYGSKGPICALKGELGLLSLGGLKDGTHLSE